MAIVAIVATVIFAGCIIEENMLASQPKYVRGDVILSTDGAIWVIFDYNTTTDKYESKAIDKQENTWVAWSGTEGYDDRDYVEKWFTKKIDHVDPSTIMSYEEYRSSLPKPAPTPKPAPKYHRGDVIMGTSHLYVILDYNQTTDEYKTTLVQDTDALGLCYLAREESSYFARWQSREYLEKYNVLFVHDHVDPSNIKSAKEYYREYGY